MEDHFKIVGKFFRALDTPGAHISRSFFNTVARTLTRHIAGAIKDVRLGLANRPLHPGVAVFMPVGNPLVQESKNLNVGCGCLLDRADQRKRHGSGEK